MFEYRVRWQREGKQKRIKIYQTMQGAMDFVDTLEGNWAQSDEAIEHYINVPPLVYGPLIEKRPVGIWS
jgi:hypothetical protein